MEDIHDLVDVLLLSDCNLYERYPELVHRVDYFLYDWTEHMLARTQALLRKHARRIREGTSSGSSGEDEAFTHSRSVNVVWRQWAVCRLQLPRYPPERINWNKDADPVFLYAQMPALRLEVPWSARNLPVSPPSSLKPALKRTDLQTFLTSPTLSPVSSPAYSPLASPALSIRETLSSSSLGSDSTLDTDRQQVHLPRPRLRFNDQVEQCMVVFKQEHEYIPTDYEDDSADEPDTPVRCRRSVPSSKRHSTRNRRTLVIKLAPTQLKDDHRRVITHSTVSGTGRSLARMSGSDYGADNDNDDYDIYDDDEYDVFGDCDAGSIALFGTKSDGFSSTVTQQQQQQQQQQVGGVGGYVHGCVQSVAGQFRRFVSDAVLSSTFTLDKTKRSNQQHRFQEQQSTLDSSKYVPDPYASHRSPSPPSGAAYDSASVSVSSTDALNGTKYSISHVRGSGVLRENGYTPRVAASTDKSSAGIVRDPFNSTQNAASQSCHNQFKGGDHMPFDDDEDAIIQEFEREMHRCSFGPPSAAPRSPDAHSKNSSDSFERASFGSANTNDIYFDDSEYTDYHDESESGYMSRHTPPLSGSEGSVANSGANTPNMRNESIIDRAEDTIVNTVDAVKWCASFLSNYTIF